MTSFESFALCTSTCPPWAARMSGVQRPGAFCRATALASSSVLITKAWPRQAAPSKALWPLIRCSRS